DRLTDGICELTLETTDLARLERFYCAAFGCRVLTRQEDRVWLSVGPRARLGLWLPGEKEFGDKGGRHVHFALAAPTGRLTTLARRLEELDIPHRGPIRHEGGDRSLYVEDPEGNVVEVWDFFHSAEGAHGGVEALA